MADWRDLSEENGFRQLARMYKLIAGTCSMLPLPITLAPAENARFGGIIEAVARVAKIINENPIPTEVEAAIFASCTYWLAAMELFAAFRVEPKEYRANAFAMLILDSEASLYAAIDWLAKDGS
ncbi:hypothetical protein [Streptomyces sp. NPDC002537]